jgi:hypothetical protein
MLAKIVDGIVVKFPYSVEEMVRDNPNTSFPDTISEEIKAYFGVFPVLEAPMPEHDTDTQYVEYKHEPILQGDTWFLIPRVLAYSNDQLLQIKLDKAETIRSERNKLLSETDWMALSDVTMTPEMATYRQALRDITKQIGFPMVVDWPIKP